MNKNNILIEKAYSIIVARAKKYNPIYYADLYEMIELDHNLPKDRHVGSSLLEEINKIFDKVFNTNLMLTSFVVSKGGNGPYKGFYSLAERLGRINTGLSDDGKQTFWIDEMKKIYNKLK